MPSINSKFTATGSSDLLVATDVVATATIITPVILDGIWATLIAGIHVAGKITNIHAVETKNLGPFTTFAVYYSIEEQEFE